MATSLPHEEHGPPFPVNMANKNPKSIFLAAHVIETQERPMPGRHDRVCAHPYVWGNWLARAWGVAAARAFWAG